MAGIIGYKTYAVHLDKWEADAVIVRREDGGTYFAIRPLCRALGIQSQAQMTALQADERYVEALHPFKIVTDGGPQDALCIRRRECAWWLANISPKRVRADVRDRLQEFQADLMAEADRLAFGDLSSVLGRSGALVPARPTRGELTFGCPRCGASLCFVVEGSDIHLRVN